MCVGDEKYRGRTRHVIGRTRSERLAQRRSSSDQTKPNAMTSFVKGRQRRCVYRQIHCRPGAGFSATVKPILLVVPRSDPRGVDKHAGAMVGSETIGSLDAGERKDDNEGTLFWRCVSFRCFDGRQRGDDTCAPRHDRQRGHQSRGGMRTGILARARRALSSVCCVSCVPARISPRPRGEAVLAKLSE
jgi:hypothetical protein